MRYSNVDTCSLALHARQSVGSMYGITIEYDAVAGHERWCVQLIGTFDECDGVRRQ